MNFVEMKQKDIKPLKEKLWLINNKQCPVLGKEIPLEKMVLDHIHKRMDEDYSENKGAIREALDFRVNAVLGKLENSLKRTGLLNEPDFDIVEFLHKSADYFERGAYREYRDNEYSYYIHPDEVPKAKLIKKSCYNKLAKVYDGKAKLPEYNSKGKQKLTKTLESLFEKYKIEIDYY